MSTLKKDSPVSPLFEPCDTAGHRHASKLDQGETRVEYKTIDGVTYMISYTKVYCHWCHDAIGEKETNRVPIRG